MMLQSCDLNAPQKASGFNKKQSVKDIQPAKVKAVTFNPSQKARQWTQDSEELTELFMLPRKLFTSTSAFIESSNLSLNQQHETGKQKKCLNLYLKICYQV